MITIQDVSKTVMSGGQPLTILHPLSIDIAQGDTIAIVGPSGSGKSTLLNMITGIDRPSNGSVMVLGEPIHRLSENQLARWRGGHVGIIFQFFQLLPALTLVKNVQLPMDLAGKIRPRERRARSLAPARPAAW